MQTEIILGVGLFVVGLIAIFVTGAAERIFGSIYDKIGSRISEYRGHDDDFQIDVCDCVHTVEDGRYVYNLGMDITNESTETIRVSNITIKDEKGHILEYFNRGHTGAVTKFELYGGSNIHWAVFCRGEIIREKKEQTRVKVEIQRIGRKTTKIEIVSTLVSKQKFPSGEWFRFY